MRLNRWLALAAILGAILSVSAMAQQIPEARLYALLPHDYPYPLIRVCSTDEGICLLPFTIPPGRPCECQRPDGYWIPGLCIR